MTGSLKQMLLRVTPPMLRSNSPNRPMTMRRRHWFLQETKFLFLTRKGPVELTVKPALIVGGAFVGVVGMGVITATTLFLGFKSVEVVSKETITPAEANVAATVAPSVPSDPSTAEARPTWPPSLAATTDAPAIDTTILSVLREPHLPAAANLAEPDGMIAIPDAEALAPSDLTRLAGEYAADELVTGSQSQRSEVVAPPLIDIPDPEILPLPLQGQLAFRQPAGHSHEGHPSPSPFMDHSLHLNPDFEGRLDQSPVRSTPPQVEAIALVAPVPSVKLEDEEGPMEPLILERNVPVFTAESREKKVLRSMASEIRNIRISLGGLGVGSELMPTVGSLEDQIESADFASLAMAVEDHRSMLRKIPLKPPMLYFYISSEYGYRMHPVLKKKTFHHGIDLAGTWQEDVQASAPGTVVFAGTKGSFGKVVQVRHDYGIFTTYAHLAKISVRTGADVLPGTVIGKMGRTGRVKGAHLHYEIRIGDQSVNPRAFFDIGHRIGVGGELMRASDNS